MENSNLNYDDILNSQTFKKILKVDFFEQAYDLIGDYSDIFSDSFIVKKKLQNKLFIAYLQYKSNKKNIGSLFERVLIVFLNRAYSDDIIEYLLSKDLNLNYTTTDKNGISVSLLYILTNNIQKTQLMELLLKKLNNSRYIFFKNNYYKKYNDLCRMNILAGNIEKAFQIFNYERYNLFNIEDKTIDIQRELFIKQEISIDNFDYEEDDLLYKIILTINESCLQDKDKKKLLINILKSKKIKLFNTTNLILIKEILGNENYQSYLKYLRKLELSYQIILYTGNPSLRNTICYATLANTLYLENLFQK